MNSHTISKAGAVPQFKYAGRRRFVLAALLGCMSMLIGRAFDLQVLERKEFLQRQGKLRHVAVVSMPAHRGRILDRNSDPLAISTPVQSVWINPRKFSIGAAEIKKLAKVLQIPPRRVAEKVQNRKRKFVFLKRGIDPQQAAELKRLDLAGLNFENEYRRYYPSGEVTSHLLGFSNIDDFGQEGMELAYNQHLRGFPGKKRVIRDGNQQIIEDLEKIHTPVAGHDLVLTIDQRLQYLAYRELSAAVKKNKARSGSLLLLSAKTGEVLAMVNQPSFNPHIRRNLKVNRYRNRAMTDVFEPGSTIKPFVIACALEAESYQSDSLIDTSPGLIRVGRNVVRDIRNYGRIDVTGVLQKSSNVGITKIALSLSPFQLWDCYHGLGFAESSGIGFPGEAVGTLTNPDGWNKFEQATMSFGYGLSVSTLQLAQAYSILANGGIKVPLSLLKKNRLRSGVQVMSNGTASNVVKMLEKAVGIEGTGWSAHVPGYRVAGKTGTVKRSTVGGYSSSEYVALFAGMAPVPDPKLIMVVVIDVPSAGDYYGGKVAAPVFSKLMGAALRMLGVPPEKQQAIPLIIANQGDLA